MPLTSFSVGRPQYDVTYDQLEFLIGERFTIERMAQCIQVSGRTIRRMLAEFGFRLGKQDAGTYIPVISLPPAGQFSACPSQSQLNLMRDSGSGYGAAENSRDDEISNFGRDRPPYRLLVISKSCYINLYLSQVFLLFLSQVSQTLHYITAVMVILHLLKELTQLRRQVKP